MTLKTPEAEEQPTQSKSSEKKSENKDISRWTDLANQRIEEAMQAGAFDNLAGKGKPQQLNPNPNEPPEMIMANKLLKDNDLAPAWIVDRRDMLEKIAAFRQELQTGCHRYQTWLAQDTEPTQKERTRIGWQRQTAAWQAEIDGLNKAINVVNLTIPIWRMEVLKLRLDAELARLGASREEPGAPQ